ncbi:MAG: hypothetical protein SFT90_05755 [Rickettsiales bacterium]|nr:hypothetical protein [Rickettsiales bacterium]
MDKELFIYMLSTDFEKILISKASKLSDIDLIQLMNFAEFLVNQKEEKALKDDSLLISAPKFKEIWDNEDDEIYDRI